MHDRVKNRKRKILSYKVSYRTEYMMLGKEEGKKAERKKIIIRQRSKRIEKKKKIKNSLLPIRIKKEVS